MTPARVRSPGVEIVRNVGLGTEPEERSSHAYIRYADVRVPTANLLGPLGGAFEIAPVRLGGGRIHHAMRTMSHLNKAFQMMCERALFREVKGGGTLASLQMTQEKIADSWIEIEQLRLLVLRTARRIDKYQDYKRVRRDIAAVKVAMPRVMHDVVQRAMHLHGALGISNEMPFAKMMVAAQVLAIGDGPTEVHKLTVARAALLEHQRVEGLWPRQHLPSRRAIAQEHLARILEGELANL